MSNKFIETIVYNVPTAAPVPPTTVVAPKNLFFKKTGKTKVEENYVVITGKMMAEQCAFLDKFKQHINYTTTLHGYPFNQMYIGGAGLKAAFIHNKLDVLPLVVPHGNTYFLNNVFEKLPYSLWSINKAKFTPEDFINTYPFIDECCLMDWPTAKMNVKIYIHRQSYMCRYYTPKYYLPDTGGFNFDSFDKLPSLRTWNTLAEYIKHRSENWGASYVRRQVVCNLVKSIMLTADMTVKQDAVRTQIDCTIQSAHSLHPSNMHKLDLKHISKLLSPQLLAEYGMTPEPELTVQNPDDDIPF
jgi:hypothetical protein